MDKKIYSRDVCDIVDDNVSGGGFLEYFAKEDSVINEHLLKRRPLSYTVGVFAKSPLSQPFIAPFCKKNNIKTDEMLDDVSSFKSFNDFFIRRLKKDARPFSTESSVLVSPCDSRLLCLDINKADVLDIKGFGYTLESLLSSKTMAKNFYDGTCLIFRLAPDDYHRFIFFDDCYMTCFRKKGGFYNSVNTHFVPMSVHAENYRQMCLLKTENFGLVAQIEVGAMNVGSVVQHRKCGHFKRGDEKGYFEFGGSTVILLFRKDTIEIDSDIKEYSLCGIETRIRQGETIGKKF